MKAVHNDGSESVMKLSKALYGLKQAAKEWYTKLKSVLCSLGFTHSTVDPCCFHVKNSGDRIFLLVYVDDIIVAEESDNDCEFVMGKLKYNFEFSAMRNTHFFLGFEIQRDRRNRMIFISQTSYMDKILRRFNMANSSASIPMSPGIIT